MNLRLVWRLWGTYTQLVAGWQKARKEAAVADPTVATGGKALITSKLFWAALLGTLVQVLPGIRDFIPQPYSAIAVGLVTILLRCVTSQPITGILVQGSATPAP